MLTGKRKIALGIIPITLPDDRRYASRHRNCRELCRMGIDGLSLNGGASLRLGNPMVRTNCD
jgi:hypothetical protein